MIKLKIAKHLFVMALPYVLLDFLNDAFDSILKRKILVEEETNLTVVQNNKEKLGQLRHLKWPW